MSRRYARPHEVELVRWSFHAGMNDSQISRTTNIARPTVREWRTRPTEWPAVRATRDGRPLGAACPRCHGRALDPGTYAYLLGIYLGDGHIARMKPGVFRLSIFLDQRYGDIISECADAMARVRGAGCQPNRARRDGCVAVNAYWKQWPCLFPQHGAGMKHTRPILLADWQRGIADAQPERLLRGLIHSDGWRGMNRVTTRGKQYAYPRHNFSNRSDDIRAIFTRACDLVGVSWRRMNASDISIARKDSVARLDAFIGPKL